MKQIKIIITLCALCLCAFCSCSKNEEQNTSSEKTTETTAVTTVSTTNTTAATSELADDVPPPYMYYDGKTYTALNKAEETFMSSDDKITEKLNGYECIGNTHELTQVGDMQFDLDVTSLPDNAKVYYDPEKADDSDPFMILSEANGQTTIYYMNLLNE